MKNSNKESVQNWRKRTKDRIVRAFGSKCACCGYSKCIEALQFHHLDPSSKETTVSNLIANIKGWSTIVDEARKCIMVCANCHTEIHAKVREVPENAARFDEAFAEYRKTDFGEQTECVVCKTLIPSNQSTCSAKCAGAKANSIIWDDEQLKQMFSDHRSLSEIGRHFGVSSASVGKRLKKLGLR